MTEVKTLLKKLIKMNSSPARFVFSFVFILLCKFCVCFKSAFCKIKYVTFFDGKKHTHTHKQTERERERERMIECCGARKILIIRVLVFLAREWMRRGKRE
jgi:hypothetical protein